VTSTPFGILVTVRLIFSWYIARFELSDPEFEPNIPCPHPCPLRAKAEANMVTSNPPTTAPVEIKSIFFINIINEDIHEG
jgi:hypothetical protein